MSSIDERVVEMKFKNSQFKSGVKESLDSLSQLKKGLDLSGAAKGIKDVENAGKSFSLASMASAVENVSSKFNALGAIGFTVLQNLTNSAINAGTRIASALTIDPIKAGFSEYETQMNSIQTIMANTANKGTTLDQVSDALDKLNKYSDDTIYNFSEMARNIGTFTAAGVDLDTSTSAIKGIANLAAVSGSNSQQASTAMYQLSQAMATGTVKLMDWNSVVNAGMGGQVFQDALTETARVSGVAIDDIIEKNGSFRNSLQEGWLTTEILTNTLSKFTGDMNEEQLRSMGYSEEQIAKVIELGKMANDAATKVKTLTQLQQTLTEAAQSGWAKTWQILVGDFEEAKVLYTNISNVIGGFINASANARNAVLTEWKDSLGGRNLLIDGLTDAFNGLLSIAKPISEAFREIFPPVTAQQLLDLTQKLHDLTQGLSISQETADKVKRAFKGVFALFSIGWEAVKALGEAFGDFLGKVSPVGGSLLDIAANLGDLIVKLNEAVKSSGIFSAIFGTIGDIIANVILVVKNGVGAIADLVTGISEINSENLGSFLERIGERFTPLTTMSESLHKALSKISPVFATIADAASQVIDILFNGNFTSGPFAEDSGFVDMLFNIRDAIKNVLDTLFSKASFEGIVDAMNSGLLIAIGIAIKKFIDSLTGFTKGGDGFLDSVKGILDGVTGSLEAMQAKLKADTLLKIAGAVALLALAVIGLSLVDSDKLASALAGLGVLLGEMFAMMAIMKKHMTGEGFAKLPIVAVTMILLAVAINIMVIAVKNLAELSWEELLKGLSGLGLVLGELAVFMKLADFGGMGIRTGIGLILLAVAIKILASAVGDFASLDINAMAKGLGAIGILLLELAAFTRLAGDTKGFVSTGIGLLIISAALIVLSEALKRLGNLSLEQIGKGLLAMAGALAAITISVNLMPKDMLSKSIALLVISAALLVLSNALTAMSGMTWEEIARGLTVLGASLVIIAAAMVAMQGALAGAAALLLVTVALNALAPVLKLFGAMSLAEIGKSLLMLAGVFILFGVAGAVLAPVVVAILAFSVAIGLVGAAVYLAGLGVLAFATALTLLVAAGAAGTGAIVGLTIAIIGLIPLVMKNLAEGIIAFIVVMNENIPLFKQVAVNLITAICQGIVETAATIISALMTLVWMMVDTLVANVPQLVAAGFELLLGLLTGIRDNIGNVVTVALEIITEFINAISANIGQVIDAGTNLAISFINGVADSIRNNSGILTDAAINLGTAVIDGLVSGLQDTAGRVWSAALALGQKAISGIAEAIKPGSPSKVTTILGKYTGLGLIVGMQDTGNDIYKAGASTGQRAIDGLKDTLSNMSDIINADINLEPTIKPVLDLDDVVAGSKRLNSLFGNGAYISTQVGNAEASIISKSFSSPRQSVASSVQSAPVTQPASVSFTQNNYSPKELSRLDIYRQTRNQLSAVRGALTV